MLVIIIDENIVKAKMSLMDLTTANTNVLCKPFEPDGF